MAAFVFMRGSYCGASWPFLLDVESRLAQERRNALIGVLVLLDFFDKAVGDGSFLGENSEQEAVVGGEFMLKSDCDFFKFQVLL